MSEYDGIYPGPGMPDPMPDQSGPVVLTQDVTLRRFSVSRAQFGTALSFLGDEEIRAVPYAGYGDWEEEGAIQLPPGTVLTGFFAQLYESRGVAISDLE